MIVGYTEENKKLPWTNFYSWFGIQTLNFNIRSKFKMQVKMLLTVRGEYI